MRQLFAAAKFVIRFWQDKWCWDATIDFVLMRSDAGGLVNGMWRRNNLELNKPKLEVRNLVKS